MFPRRARRVGRRSASIDHILSAAAAGFFFLLHQRCWKMDDDVAAKTSLAKARLEKVHSSGSLSLSLSHIRMSFRNKSFSKNAIWKSVEDPSIA